MLDERVFNQNEIWKNYRRKKLISGLIIHRRNSCITLIRFTTVSNFTMTSVPLPKRWKSY